MRSKHKLHKLALYYQSVHTVTWLLYRNTFKTQKTVLQIRCRITGAQLVSFRRSMDNKLGDFTMTQHHALWVISAEVWQIPLEPKKGTKRAWVLVWDVIEGSSTE